MADVTLNGRKIRISVKDKMTVLKLASVKRICIPEAINIFHQKVEKFLCHTVLRVNANAVAPLDKRQANFMMPSVKGLAGFHV